MGRFALIWLALCLVAVALAGCSQGDSGTPDAKTGAQGAVEFGQGDCMPCGCADAECSNCPKKTYAPYDGDLVFIKKGDLDSLGQGDFTELEARSAKTPAAGGQYRIELPPGEYLVMPRGVYQPAGNGLLITPGTMTEQDFKFFECLSY